MAPQLSIVIDGGGPSTIYHPGQLIRGQVSLQCSGSVDVECVLIIFVGLVQVEFQRQHGGGFSRGAGTTYSFYKDDSVLFSVESQLFVGPYTLPAGAHQWTFEFIIPTGSSTGPPGSNQHHALPPTFASNLLEHFIRGSCRITYQLNARLMRPGALKIDPRAEHFLTVLPWSLAPSGPARFIESSAEHVHRSSLLQPGREKASRSFKEKLKDNFSNDAPSVTFTLKCSICDVNVNGAIQANLTLQHDTARSTTTVVPDFSIKGVSAVLVAYTTCLNRRYNAHDPSLFNSDIALDRVTVSSQNIVSGQSIQLLMPLPNVPPSFMSQLVSRWYALRLRVKVECAGKSFDSKFESLVNIVVPSSPEAVAYGAESSSGAMEVPPAYEHSVTNDAKTSKDG